MAGPVAARVKKMNLYMEAGQRIDFDKKCNAMGQCVACNSKAFYPWQRAVYGVVLIMMMSFIGPARGMGNPSCLQPRWELLTR